LDVEIGGVNLKPPSDGAFLNEADLPKIKGTFWHNNITGFAPMLPVNVTLERDGKRKLGHCLRQGSVREPTAPRVQRLSGTQNSTSRCTNNI